MAGEQLSNNPEGVLFVQATDDPGETPISYIKVGGATAVQVPSPTRDEIDVTSLDSGGQETIPGIANYGETTFDLFLRAANEAAPAGYEAGQARLAALADSGKTVSFKVEMPEAFGVTVTCNGWVKAFQENLGTGEAAKASVTIRWTGKPVRS